MTRRFVPAVLAVILMLCPGCVAVNFSYTSNRYKSSEFIDGKGSMVTVEYPAGPFTAVEIYNEYDMELYYTAEQSDKVTIELQENLTECLDVSVENGVLTIEPNRPFRSEQGKIPRLYVSAPVLERIEVYGGMIAIRQSDAVKGGALTLDVSGALDGALPVEVDTLDVEISGACSLTLSGSAKKADIHVSGVGHLDALELQTEKAEITINGAGNVQISCSDELDADINGTGNISYRGNPHVTQNIAGAASVNRMD